jgi:TetR/AcrR family transcriptional repressor of nem operon
MAPTDEGNDPEPDSRLKNNTYGRIIFSMPKPSHRGRIVEAGLKVMFRKGYGGAGVRDIVAEASVPQGSFTNHFRSKEEFAREVLDLYFVDLKRLVAEVLDDANRRPRERLRRYLDVITDRLVEAEFSRGCLIGDFSLEAAPQSEMLRTRLAEIFAEWRTPFAACIAEGQRAGEIAETFAPHDLAEFLLSSWEGAILRMKVERTTEPLERFKRIVFMTIFKEPSP